MIKIIAGLAVAALIAVLVVMAFLKGSTRGDLEVAQPTEECVSELTALPGETVANLCAAPAQ